MARGNNGFMTLAGIGLLAGAVYYFRDTSKQARYIKGVRVTIADIKNDNNIFTVYLQFQNTNSAPAVIRSVVGKLYANNKMVGNVSQFKKIEVKGNAVSVYPVVVKLNAVNTVIAVMEILRTLAGSSLTFKGIANIDNKPMDINVKYTYNK